MLLSATIAGGVFVSDDTDVDVSGSSFNNNHAGLNGGVAYFRAIGPLPSASVQNLVSSCTMAATGNCTMLGNNATRWGAVLSLDIDSLRVIAPDVTRPGIGFTAYVTLYDGEEVQRSLRPVPAVKFTRSGPRRDKTEANGPYRRPSGLPPAGFGQPVWSLSTASVTVQLVNTTGSLSGTLRMSYLSANTPMALNLKGNSGNYLIMRFYVDATDENPVPITGDTGVSIATCNALETFDQSQLTCVCTPNAERESGLNASSACLCSAGFTAVNNACSACAAGSFTSTRGTSCVVCPTGFVAPDSASTSCTACPNNAYSYSRTQCGASCSSSIQLHILILAVLLSDLSNRCCF